MATDRGRSVIRHIHTLFDAGTVAGMADGPLLERYAKGRGEAAERAFAALVERHGPMVLRVCRAALPDPHDAEDAFQATFLVLVRRAGSLWVRDSLGPWLHGVAVRVAATARADAARRREHERKAGERPAPVAGEAACQELAAVLHEEVARLPERHRVPMILCDLEGQTHEEAARRLGWPVGTVKSRLSRGRERLRGRLIRRGLAPPVGMLGVWLAGDAEASVSPMLVDAMARVAMRIATGRAAINSLAQGVLHHMVLIKLKVAGAALLGITAAAVVAPALMKASDGPRGDREAGPEARTVTAPDHPADPLMAQIREAVRAAADIPSGGQFEDRSDDSRVRHPKIKTLLVLGSAQAELGDRAAARETLAHAVEVAGNTDLDSWRAGTLARIARAQVDAGDLEGARESLRKAIASAKDLTENWKTDALRVIVSVQMAMKEPDEARATLQALREIVPGMRGVVDEGGGAMSDLIAATAMTGDYDEAIRWLDMASDRVSAPGKDDPVWAGRRRQSWKDQGLFDIARIADERGDFKESRRLVHLIVGEEAKGKALSFLAWMQAERGEDARGVMAWIADVESPRLRAKALDGLARGLAGRAGMGLVEVMRITGQ